MARLRFKAWLLKNEGFTEPPHGASGQPEHRAHRDAKEGRPGAFYGDTLGGDPIFNKKKNMKDQKKKKRGS